MVRDIALAASGLLSSKMYGPPVMPYQPNGLWGAFPGNRGRPDEWMVSRRGPLPAGALYLHSAERPLSESYRIRRAVSRILHRQAKSQRYAFAGAHDAQRPGLL